MEQVIVTAEELYEATRETRKALQEKTDEELLEEWFEWFKKKGPSYIRDSVKKGLYKVTMDLPFQPLFKENGEPDPNSYSWRGKSLWKRLTEMLPGCKIEYIEEEYDCVDGFPGYVLEINWKLKKPKKKGFVMEELVPTMTTSTLTTSTVTAASMMASTVTSSTNTT